MVGDYDARGTSIQAFHRRITAQDALYENWKTAHGVEPADVIQRRAGALL